jgi:zinc transport system substrate-binding protein
MKRLLPLLLVLGLLCTGCASSADTGQEDAVHIVATTYPVYLFASAVTDGVEGVEVTRLITEAVSCLHDYTLTVKDMKAIERADVLILSGAGLEDFMEDALAQTDAAVIDCSQNAALLPSLEDGDHGHGEDQEDDPHIWMSPENAAAMLEAICQGLSRLDADHARQYAENYAAACTQLASIQEAPGELDCPYLITFHDGFQYFAQASGLTLLKSIEEEEGSEASAAEIKEIVALIRDYDIPAIFTEKNGSDATAQAIARETGVAVVQLDLIMSGEGNGVSAYVDAMNENLDAIAQALGGN